MIFHLGHAHCIEIQILVPEIALISMGTNQMKNPLALEYFLSKHPEIELERSEDTTLYCPRCQKQIEIISIHSLTSQCLRALNREIFKNAKLIRLDDWYTPEIKRKVKDDPDYWINVDVKKDRDGDTIIVLYVGYKGAADKTQFFIKPEKLQLSNDHKDLDPAKILSKIEVTLRNRTITQTYDEDENSQK